MRLLVTRPEPDASDMKVALEALGTEVVAEPMLTIEFIGQSPGHSKSGDQIKLDGVQALIATSRNGLRALTAGGTPPGLVAAALKLPLFAVGPGTASLAREMGFAKLYLGPGTAASLPPMIAAQLQAADGALLQLAGANMAEDLAPALKAAGFDLRRPTLYRAISRDRFSDRTKYLFQQGKIDGVVLMSPRTADIYARLVTDEQLFDFTRQTTHFCLSEKISERLHGLGNTVIKIACKPNMEEMLALIAVSVAKRR